MFLQIENEDEDVRHGDREDVPEQTVEVKEKDKPSVKETLVCSCGSTTCYAIGALGHPRPVFVAEIEPLFPQSARDLRARILKQTS